MTTREKFEKWAIEKKLAFRDKNGLWPLCGANLPHLRFAWEAARAEALEEALEAVRAERLEDPSKNPDDIAYDMAVDDCADAIRALAKDEGGAHE
ncbi:hypothetical protein SB783_32175 [Paraburkholderia sp. SIMBA_009]